MAKKLTQVKLKPFMNNTITITNGEYAENHIHNQKIGNNISKGLSYEDLKKIKKMFEDKGENMEIICLNDIIEEDDVEDIGEFDKTNEAYILIWRNGVDYILNIDQKDIKKTHYDMYKEQNRLNPDKHFWNIKTKSVCNKRARWNLCFDNVGQVADYENGKGTIIAFDDIPLTKKIKMELEKMIGNVCSNLVAEGNYYFNSKCYINFHGDVERKIVIAVRLGKSMPLFYQWYYKNKKVGKRLEINLNSGDIYFMSEKAVGCDWKKRNIYTLRHAAGNIK